MRVLIDVQVLLKRSNGWTMEQTGAMIASALEKVRTTDCL